MVGFGLFFMDWTTAPGEASDKNTNFSKRVLLTGLTGYIGGRLTPELLRRGHEVVCVVRSKRKLDERAWPQDPRVTVVEADIQDRDQVRSAAMPSEPRSGRG